MAFVYRFRKDGKTIYIGKVTGPEPQNLVSRLYCHARDSSFYAESDYVEYIDGLTSMEADILETVFINFDRKHLFNKSKLCEYPIRFSVSYVPRWKRLNIPKKETTDDGEIHQKDFFDVLKTVRRVHGRWNV